MRQLLFYDYYTWVVYLKLHFVINKNNKKRKLKKKEKKYM